MSQLPYPPIGVSLNKGGQPDRAWAVWFLNLYRLLGNADDTSLGELIDQITSGLYDLPTEPPRSKGMSFDIAEAPSRKEKATTIPLGDTFTLPKADSKLLDDMLSATLPRKIRPKDLAYGLASPPPIGSTTPNTSAFTTSTATTSYSAPLFTVNGATGTSRDVDFRSAGVRRWYLRCNSSAETGSNAGSNLQLTALDDSGNAIDSVFTVNRAASGTFTMPRPMRFTNTTETTSSTTGGAIFSGGVYVAKTIWGALARFGGATNYTLFEADGTRVAKGAATTFDDVYPSGISLGVGSSAPSFTAYNGNMKAYEFIGTTSVIKEYHLAFQIPHAYKEASTVEPHLHLYIPNDVTGGVVKFYCEYTWVSVNGAEPSTTTISGTVTVAAGAGAQGNVILSFGNVTGTGKTISSILSCRIYRDPADAADTFAASVWIKSADVHIECDTDGSRTITAK